MQKILNFIKKNKQFSFFFLLVILLIFVAVFAPVIAPQDPYVSDLKNALQAPNSEHWFGTDKLGRDIFSRVIYASRISLPATLTLVAIIFVAGTILGTLAGYFGGWVDAVIMRLSDMMISFPGMVLAIAVAGIMGASIKNAVIAIAIVSWSKYARLARSLVMKIRHAEWGLMLNEGRTYMQNAPWMMIYPGLAIFIVVVIFNLLGDSLRDVLDVREE